ncbi:hypothetical protein GALMADRAFT_148940 [Galerina marginata CBS 339.88]|uniref:Uncharacterized protein n=1 Tax=Galerina marginata (strain CBS 339.88) TaxID=685588 RepID=A0A067S2V0_GALM3|nr:hypothetical protein GALMADRAFT_148940 [Galerina marginata CBS 339.88]
MKVQDNVRSRKAPGAVSKKLPKPWEVSRTPVGESPVFFANTIPVTQNSDTVPQPRQEARQPLLQDGPIVDDIRTEYHPASGRPASVVHFEDYREHDPVNIDPPHNPEPWKPFQTRLDFEFAQLAHDAALNKRQVEKLIDLLQRCAKGVEMLTIKTPKNLADVWDQASEMLTPFQKHVISVRYKEVYVSFDFWSRSLWNWALDLVKNPILAPHFQWDARKLYKYNGKEFIRFIHEPWTADRWWRIQTLLPEGGKPLCFIIYADKTKLSSFGTVMGYPVIARLANLPVEFRNSRGLGGGEVVGWLPIVGEEEEERGDPQYVNFKRVVWHESFRKLLESIKEFSKTGYNVYCGDGIFRHLFPLILFLSADYEEACVMVLIRGFKGLCPCPVCLVPKNELHNLRKKWPKRSASETRELVQLARKATTGVAREEILKPQSIRNVVNAFWDVEHSDPFRTISYDKMHYGPHGLGGKHLWPALQLHVKAIGKAAMHKVDIQAHLLPRWRGLNHFNKILNIQFSDANKYEDIMKLSIFISHNILEKNISTSGYILLRCVRSYLKVDAYTAMEVHTSETIDIGRQEILKFSDIMKEYISAIEDTNFDKNWDFPKHHFLDHVFDDILAKGVTRNYDSKAGEGMHPDLKKSFALRTNYKEVGPQILRASHRGYIAMHIVSQILAQTELEDKHVGKPDEVTPDEEHAMKQPDNQFGNIYLGAPQSPTTIKSIESSTQSKPWLQGFHRKLEQFLQGLFRPLQPTNVPRSGAERYGPSYTSIEDLLTECRFIKSFYESKINWKTAIDYLRCSPQFGNAERYDSVIFNTDAGLVFAQLRFVFKISIKDQVIPIALVQAFDRISGHTVAMKRKDKDLGFIRLRKKGDKDTEVIPARSIIRGVCIFPAFDRDGDHLVFDVVDPDLLLRLDHLAPT